MHMHLIKTFHFTWGAGGGIVAGGGGEGSVLFVVSINKKNLRLKFNKNRKKFT